MNLEFLRSAHFHSQRVKPWVGLLRREGHEILGAQILFDLGESAGEILAGFGNVEASTGGIGQAL